MLTSMGITACEAVTGHSNCVQKEKANEAKGGILLCPAESLECVDDNMECGGACAIRVQMIR